MKTQILMLKILIIVIVFFTACSKNDDGDGNSKSNPDLLIGIWKPIKYTGICDADSYFYHDYSLCKQKELLTIKNNGDFTEANFNIDDFWGGCNERDMVFGTWVEVNGSLKFTVNGDTLEYDFFELSKNNLKLGQFDENLLQCEGESTHFYVEYIRIN